jgi:hypothetical protein
MIKIRNYPLSTEGGRRTRVRINIMCPLTAFIRSIDGDTFKFISLKTAQNSTHPTEIQAAASSHHLL